jgi:hypothetical protein
MRLSDPVLRLTFVRRSANHDSGKDKAHGSGDPGRPANREADCRVNTPAPGPAQTTRQPIPSPAVFGMRKIAADSRVNPLSPPQTPSTRQAPPPQLRRTGTETSTDFREIPLQSPPGPLARQAVLSQVKRMPREAPRGGVLSRLFALLGGRVPPAKKLRLAETVALGEKRFVAIIDAEGRKYLIGGGTSGVALLTRLDDAANPVESLPQFREVLEAAR